MPVRLRGISGSLDGDRGGLGQQGRLGALESDGITILRAMFWITQRGTRVHSTRLAWLLGGQHLPAGLTLEQPAQLLLPLHPDPAGCPHTAQ